MRTQITRSPASLVMMNSMVGVMLEKAADTTKVDDRTSVDPTLTGQPLGKELQPSMTSLGKSSSVLMIDQVAVTRVVMLLAPTVTGSSADRVMGRPFTTVHEFISHPATEAQVGSGPPALQAVKEMRSPKMTAGRMARIRAIFSILNGSANFN